MILESGANLAASCSKDYYLPFSRDHPPDAPSASTNTNSLLVSNPTQVQPILDSYSHVSSSSLSGVPSISRTCDRCIPTCNCLRRPNPPGGSSILNANGTATRTSENEMKTSVVRILLLSNFFFIGISPCSSIKLKYKTCEV